ncbi:MAG TPA: hypothetical protein VEX60_14270 [Pyrinomonadaceae bacterium]|nr:hypothetical protein [Pyrinomonadaceae bacterium]
MPANKAAKKSKKGSKGASAKKSGAKKAATKKIGAKKGAAKKGGAKKVVGGKSPAKKGAAKKSAAKKSVPSKKAGAKAAMAAAEAQTCIDIPTAEDIIVACAPAGFDINRPLCEFLAENQLPFLQQCILDQVLARGCDIDRSDIPADCDSTLSDIIDAIVINAT